MKGSRAAGGVEVGGVRVPINIKGRSLCAGLTLEGRGGVGCQNRSAAVAIGGEEGGGEGEGERESERENNKDSL